MSRGVKQRKVHVKTTLNKSIMFIKVFPYTEAQTFYVVSPRQILMRSKLQMEKVFYSDQYYIDIFWLLDEVLGGDNELQTTLTISCDLVFVKNVALIKSKIEAYYNDNLISSFNKYLKPQLEAWIQKELLDVRQKSQPDVQIRPEEMEIAKSEIEEVDYASIVQRFIAELKRQTHGKMDERALNSVIMQGLNRGQEQVLG